MAIQPFQFTLRRLLLAMACFAFAFAVPTYLIQIVQRKDIPLGTLDAIAILCSPFLVVALVGAGFGVLFDRPTTDANHRRDRWLALCFASPLVYLLLHMFWLAFMMR